jgi:hypothetical protein
MEDFGRAREVFGDFEQDVCWDGVHGHIWTAGVKDGWVEEKEREGERPWLSQFEDILSQKRGTRWVKIKDHIYHHIISLSLEYELHKTQT